MFNFTSTTTAPFVFGAGAQNTSYNSPFGNLPTSTAPVNFFTPTSTAGTSIFGTKQTTQPATVFPPTSSGTAVKFGAVSGQGIFSTASTASNSNIFNTSGNIFSQPFPTAVTATTTTPWKPATSVAPITNIFGTVTPAMSNPFDAKPFPAPATTSVFTSTANTNPFVVRPITTQPPFHIPTTSTDIFGVPVVTTSFPSVSTTQPQLFQSLPVTQTQPTVTSSLSTQAQNTQQSVSSIQQQFLAASLLDPYANRGKKDFSNINHIQVPVVSSVSSTTTVTTSTPIPVTLPIQSNLQKTSLSRSSIDVNFKLKPVSSSPILNDDLRVSNQQSTASVEQTKSRLAGNFTDEEEIVLLGRTKMSKLRLSNDILGSSHQSDAIRSLYPLRRLADLEKLTNLTLSLSPITIASTEQTSSSSTENLHSVPSVTPIVQQKSTTHSPVYQLPILTRDHYYTKPSLIELKSSFNDKGQCIVKQFTVGHEKYGTVTFYGQTNVAGLNLDEIIEINHQEVIVYPDDNHKPSVGEELNLPARITLFGIYPIDRTTHQEITDVERIKAMNYSDHLRQITKKFDGEFLQYGISDGSWTFMVKHFTRYGLDVIIQSSLY